MVRPASFHKKRACRATFVGMKGDSGSAQALSVGVRGICPCVGLMCKRRVVFVMSGCVDVREV